MRQVKLSKMVTLQLLFVLIFLISRISSELHFAQLFDKYATNLIEKYPQNISEYPDSGLDIFAFLEKYEYPYERHHIVTEDGYILGVQRITGHRKGYTEYPSVSHKPAIILQHGLCSCSMDFVNKGPDKAIGLKLADAGWDVWLTNNRGTYFSRNHTVLDPDKDVQFWEFSWEQCGYYDTPAAIDYIRHVTGHDKIFYIGHSQGTTQFFAMAALRPQYNDKIALMTALAPVVYMKHMASPLLKLAAKYIDPLEKIFKLLNLHELLPRSNATAKLANMFCSDGSSFQEMCSMFLQIVCGFNPTQMDKSFIPFVAYNDPAGISVNMIIHYGQGINSGYFRRFDYGEMDNIRKYKVSVPPAFNLSLVTAPVVLYYSQNDLLTAVKDVDRLAAELPNLVKKSLISDKYFSHIDFIWAKDINTLINDDLLTLLNSRVYNNGNRSISSKYLYISIIIFSILRSVL